MELQRNEYSPEISRKEGIFPDQRGEADSFPEVMPRLEEISPEKQPNRKKPGDGAVIIEHITEEERKEKERQKQIEEIIRQRDEPKKRIH